MLSSLGRFLVYSCLLLASFNAFSQAGSSSIPKWKVADIKQVLARSSDTITVYNFWATWCKPCVEELPVFEQFFLGIAAYPIPLKLRMVSADFVSDVDKKVLPFLQKNGYTFPVVIVDETDANKWIDLVEPKWQGNIPFTLVVNERTQKRAFHEGKLSARELNRLIERVQ